MRKLTASLVLLTVLVIPKYADASVGSCPQWEPTLAKYGLPVGTFSRIMYRESHCLPFVSHRNRNGTVDRGLMQLNSIHLRKGGVAYGLYPAALFNPDTNIRLAAKLYKLVGMRAWQV